MNENVTARLTDLMHAANAVDAYRRADRAGLVTAMHAIDEGRRGEALLGLSVICLDQMARATNLSWEGACDVIIAAVLDPDETQAIEQRTEEEQ